MNGLTLAALIIILMGIAYQTGVTRSRAIAGGNATKLHSRPNYHGMLVAIWTLVPMLLVLGLFMLLSDAVTAQFITSQLPETAKSADVNAMDAVLRRIQSVASGGNVAGAIEPFEQAIADGLNQFRFFLSLVVVAAASGLAVAGLLYARSRISTRMRARNQVERAILWLLMASSGVAILTTLGIVASLLTEAIRFFTFVQPLDFFFGTVWNPRFQTVGDGASGQYGLIPLLWGTIMVSGIAMLVAVPIGLMSAIYLSQYAPRKVRNTVKPVIEILAGIPTIVYGFFALVTVGPFLSGLGQSVGLDVRATSALTAGVVMGIMIIPFISSLSEDILQQVPSAMRDGSLGLGATKSETIRNVLFPAALPGIVGAILLAVSRAIGETMIVVLAAGNSPVLRLNPFEPVSTVTVTIVNQLTGDTDFAGPQSLVAFALGLTLFVMTLLLNVVALYIVRKYREQYE